MQHQDLYMMITIRENALLENQSVPLSVPHTMLCHPTWWLPRCCQFRLSTLGRNSTTSGFLGPPDVPMSFSWMPQGKEAQTTPWCTLHEKTEHLLCITKGPRRCNAGVWGNFGERFGKLKEGVHYQALILPKQRESVRQRDTRLQDSWSLVTSTVVA
uniref:Uncharacterized protein n=1 Tax=Eutreptiella gymnastica TaxID=73025 RepID=A0A7S4FYH0_9EUGL